MFFVFVYFGILLQGPWSEWEYKKLYKHKVAEHEEKRRQCQTCDNKEVAKHRVDAIVVNKDLTRVTKWEDTTLWHMQTMKGTIKWQNIEAMRADAVFVIKNYKVKKHLVMTHVENVSKHKLQSDEAPRRCESMRFLWFWWRMQTMWKSIKLKLWSEETPR